MKALLIVDVQNDFLPGGTLPVPAGDEVIGVINALQERFDLVVASKDWHPKMHISFAATHGKQVGDSIPYHGKRLTLWPIHCVQNSQGAAFPSSLKTSAIAHVFYKGTDPEIDSKSAFFDDTQTKGTGLEAFLKERGVDELYVVGLATDVCVKASVLDALKLGFKVFVIENGCRGIDDPTESLSDMRHAGAHISQEM